MTRKELRDKNNRFLGHMDEIWPGQVEGYDQDNRFVGHYDSNWDETRDENNQLYGKGNMLAALIATQG